MMIVQTIEPIILEKISFKVNALLERAKSTDSEGEAANCVALAQKMLWKNNLEESQLLSNEELKRRSKPEFIKDGINIGYSKYAIDHKFNSREWKSELIEILAKNFFCRLRDGYGEIVTLVGEPKNIQIVKDLYNYLQKQIRHSRKLAFNLAVENKEIHYAEQQRKSRYLDKPRSLSQFAIHSFKDSFAKGAVSMIAKRLEEQQKENIKDADKQYNDKQSLNPGSNLNDVTHSFGNSLVTQIFNEIDEAYYEFFPEENPATIKLREYERLIAYEKRMKELETERIAREERIQAGLELPPTPEKLVPYKESKQRGRKRKYRDTLNTSAFYTGRIAGSQMEINKLLSGNKTALNK